MYRRKFILQFYSKYVIFDFFHSLPIKGPKWADFGGTLISDTPRPWGAQNGAKKFHVKSVDFSRGRVTFLFDHAKTADSNGFNTKIPYFAPPHAYLISWDPLWWQKRKKWADKSTHEQAWASMSKSAKSADSSRFDIKIPYFGPPHACLTSWDPLWSQKRKNEHT